MARREIVVLTDDLDGSDKDVRNVTFGFEGRTYEIDLGPDNHDRLQQALAPFLAAARKQDGRAVGVTRAKTHTPAPTEQRAFNQRVRDWARSQGKDVSDRGRVPAHIVDAFHAAGLR